MPAIDDVAKLENSLSTPSTAPVEEKKKGPNKVAAAALTLLLILGAVGTVWWFQMNGREDTDDAYVEGHISYVSTRIAGTVTKVLVDDNQKVKAGQLLVALDPHDQEAAVRQSSADVIAAQSQARAARAKIAETVLSARGQTDEAVGEISTNQADVTSARAAVLQARDAVRQAEARIRELRAQQEYARTDFQRYETAWTNHAVAKQAYDKANQTLAMNTAQEEQAEDNLRVCKKQLLQAESKVQSEIGKLSKSKGMLTTAQSVKAEGAVDEAQYQSALASANRSQAALDEAKLQLSYTQIVSPVDGRIGKKSVELGQRVEPGQALMSIVQDQVWVIANYKETQLGKMHVGQPVEIKIDTFPEKVFKGSVDSIGPASGAKFSMLPPDNATGNFTKIVQRIPVKIVFDEESAKDYKSRIAPGMSCVVTVVTKK